uniref:Secreted protein n=1 Tax=Panagrellus redivivus TaxID=6233 RepID=A0A7E4VCR1_PANRE
MNGYHCIVFVVMATAVVGTVTLAADEVEDVVTVLPNEQPSVTDKGDASLPWYGQRPNFGNNGINQNGLGLGNQWRERQRQFGNVNQASAGFTFPNQVNRFGGYGYPNLNNQYNQYNPFNTNLAYPAFQDPRAAYYNGLNNQYGQNFRQFG